MRIDIVCVVPQILESFVSTSIVGRACEKGHAEIVLHNLHDYASDTFRHIDDTPYGGGAGMIIQCEPVFRCIEGLRLQRSYDEVIYLCPDGEQLTQSTCNSLSLCTNLILLCGHYKGIDQRIRDLLITREISVGDYVLTGGEIAAAVLTDAIVRLVPGVVGDAESVLEDSFMHGLLDAPHYTKPADFRGHVVPEVLLSGNHAKIRQWRQDMAKAKTHQRRPDLLDPEGDRQ
ncbi:MAG: tRNA (guanosine(37)-N1)-methyltransferase TrmD [Candidatus Kapabacteria bacterium]|nr:tRNA (guanosine(37)-N1)-methyltransferase TrmD [Candidatus Kapabacteria bacterium]